MANDCAAITAVKPQSRYTAPLAGGRERGPPSLFELRRGLAVALAEADAPLRAAGPSLVTRAFGPEHEVGLFADRTRHRHFASR